MFVSFSPRKTPPEKTCICTLLTVSSILSLFNAFPVPHKSDSYCTNPQYPSPSSHLPPSFTSRPSLIFSVVIFWTLSHFNNPILTHNRSGSILIFDWDDTICPSSAIDALGKDTIADYPLQLQATFLNICHKTKEIIALAKSCGDVVIITNSDEGWVRFSAGKFMPSLLPLLDEVEIVSARTRYERLYPRQPLCWKAAAFAHEVNERFNQMDEQDEIFGFGEEDSLEAAATMRQQHIEAKKTSVNSALSAPTLPPSPPSAQPMNIPTTSPDKSMSLNEENPLPHHVTPPSSSQPSPVGAMKVRERRQIISFGDSLEERTAVKIVSSQLR